MVELSLYELCSLCESLPHPNIWEDNIKTGKIINGVDGSTDYYTGINEKEIIFKVRHISKNTLEWRPKEKIIISNSDEENFNDGELINK